MADLYKINPFTTRLDNVGDGGATIGGTIVGGNPNSILYVNAAGNLGQDTLFTYDDTINALSIANNSFSNNSDYTQSTGAVTTTRNVTSGSIQLSSISAQFSLINSDALTFTTGKSQSSSYYGIVGTAYNSGRVLSGSQSAAERHASIYSFVIEPSTNSIIHSGSVSVSRYGTYSGFVVSDVLNNATLNFTGNYYGGVFAAQINITNTNSASRAINVYGLAGSASAGSLSPTNCYGGYFTATDATSNYGAFLSGATAAAYCEGNVLFNANNTYSLANSTNRASGLWSVLGNFSGNVSLASVSVLDWNSDVTLYRNAADELRTPDSIRVDTSISVATTVNTNNGITVSKSISTDTSHYGVQGSLVATGGNTTSTNVFTGLYGSVYLNAGANTFNNSYGVFGTSIIAPGQSGTVSNIYGMNFGVSNQSTSAAPVTNLTGCRVAVVSATASVTGTVSNVFGFDVASSNNSASAQVITSFFGLRVNYAVPAGNTTTFRGVYIPNPTQNTCTTARGIELGTSAGATCASTTYEHLKINNPSSGGAITSQYGIRIQDLSYATTNVAILLEGTSGLARQGLWFGTAPGDTNLYRSAADTLKTDDAFICANLTNSGLTAGRVVFTSTGGLLASDADLLFDGTTLTLGANCVMDAGGASSVEIPNGAGGTTVNATGEVCIDSTSRTFNFYDGTAEVVLEPLIEHGFYLESPVAADDIPVIRVDKAMTLVKTVYAITGGTNWVGQLQEADDAQGTNSADTQAADSTVTGTTTVTSYSNASFDAGDYIRLKTTSVSGSVTWLHVMFYFRINP